MQSIGKKDYWRFGSLALLAVSLLGPTENVSAADQGPSSSQPPYIVKVPKGATPIKSILTVGDSVNNKPDGTPYRMVGIPDGMGAFDNGDGTFTLLMNHELTSDKGISRAHGAKGSFISKWIIKKGGLEVRSGEDLIQNISTWNANASTPSYNSPATGIALSRLCSADLPAQSAFYNQDTGLGTMERIFMNGEESGTEGRAFAHLMNGTSYELPRLGKFSWENSVASPGSGDTTVVVGMDDGQGGQVYVYVGTKTNSGSEIDKAGLTNGQLYGVKVDGYLAENTATVIPPATTFTLHNFGDVSGMTGQALETASGGNTTTFNRPEDGAWDPSNPNDFYFVTTASFTGNSRLWRLRFNDRSNPAAGGTIDMLLDGS
jgi:secreted PhoX family phosphatase